MKPTKKIFTDWIKFNTINIIKLEKNLKKLKKGSKIVDNSDEIFQIEQKLLDLKSRRKSLLIDMLIKSGIRQTKGMKKVNVFSVDKYIEAIKKDMQENNLIYIEGMIDEVVRESIQFDSYVDAALFEGLAYEIEKLDKPIGKLESEQVEDFKKR